MSDLPPDSGRSGRAGEFQSFIDAALAEQGDLTAVERFSRAHDRLETVGPSYRDLIPLTAPAAGQQYAFDVDLDQCSGCKACVTACHSLNGLDEGETWREVGQLVSNDWRRPFQQIVTTACHHCVDPGCLNGCPVLAYEKDPVTGIVRHLDDQCIGCQYCILKCPYEVPKYSEHRGIVRKCDMCAQRLAVGEAPACVQACPNQAIRISVVDRSSFPAQWRGSGEVEEWGGEESRGLSISHSPAPTLPRSPSFLPGAPDPSITLPTTRYRSRRGLPAELIPADAANARLQPAHWPLVFMLVLTQFGAGVFALLPFVPAPAQPPVALCGLMALLAGLGASVLHLGRPLKAWRSFLGLRRSWLSREIVVFGLFAPLAALTAALLWFAPRGLGTIREVLLFATPVIGLVGVGCSGMIYHDTRRILWRGMRSVGRFLGTTAVLGMLATWLFVPDATLLPAMLAVVMTVKLAGEHRLLRRADEDLAETTWPSPDKFDVWSLAQSARLMRDALGVSTRARFWLGLMGGIICPLLSFLPGTSAPILASVALACGLAGEMIERFHFFRTVVPPRMPGNA